MASKQKLDLRDVEWPISILKCNEEIDGLQPGEALDVFVAHMDVVENLSLILASRAISALRWSKKAITTKY